MFIELSVVIESISIELIMELGVTIICFERSSVTGVGSVKKLIVKLIPDKDLSKKNSQTKYERKKDRVLVVLGVVKKP